MPNAGAFTERNSAINVSHKIGHHPGLTILWTSFEHRLDLVRTSCVVLHRSL